MRFIYESKKFKQCIVKRYAHLIFGFIYVYISIYRYVCIFKYIYVYIQNCSHIYIYINPLKTMNPPKP